MPTKELGDLGYGSDALTITKESDGSGTAGDFVALNGSGQVSPTTAADADLYGVLAEDAPAAGEGVSVHIEGVVFANVAGTVSDADVLEPTTTAGQWAANAQGLTHQVDEGGTAIYRLVSRGVQAYSDAGGVFEGVTLSSNAAAVKLP